jgi:hypothetical protein
MTDLPKLVQRAPTFLYAAAGIFFFASLLLSLHEASGIPTNYDSTVRPLVLSALARAVYQAALEAVYLAANGVIVHILLAIWREGSARRASGENS